MWKCRRLVWALAGLAVAAFLLIFAWRAQKPEVEYGGRKLSQWVLLLDSQSDHKAQNDAAANAFGAMRKKALPGLVEILHKREDPPLLAKLKSWAFRFHLLPPRGISLAERQYRAARACCILRGWNEVDIHEAIPDLAYHFTNTPNWQPVEAFVWALAYSAPEGVTIVTNALANASSPWIREEAARSLWISSKLRTPDIANALLSATRDPDTNVRVTAILSLQSVAKQPGLTNLIVSGVLHCLQDTNREVRKWTVNLLARCRTAQGVDAALTNMLNDPEPSVRQEAERAVHEPNPGARGSIPGQQTATSQ